MSMRWHAFLPLLVIAISGCSDPGPERFPFRGTLLLDEQPIPFKSLTLIPTDGTTGHGAAGFTDGEGKFNLQAIVPGALRDYRGCPPGQYRVVLSEPLIPITGSTPAEDSNSGEASDDIGPAAAVVMVVPGRRKRVKGSIPAIYMSDTMSPLFVKVEEGVESYQLTLSSKPGAVAASQSPKR